MRHAGYKFFAPSPASSVGRPPHSHPYPMRPAPALASDKESTWASGQVGEQRMRAVLERMLGDGWVGLVGYFNRGGEMDLLVVGPSAVVAIEVKYLNGVVHCRGDRWTRDKFDRHGNLVEQDLPVQDRKGRAPSRQVNESADALEAFLASRGQRIKVRRAVVLAHDLSRLGEVKGPGVDFVDALASSDFSSRLRTLLAGGADHPQAGYDVNALVDLIERDHAFHSRRKAVRQGQGTEAAGPAAARAVATATQPERLPQRIVIRPDRSVHVMPPLALRQLDSLVRDIKALCASNEWDLACHERVRLVVSGHLMSGARWTVLSAAQGTLPEGRERELLQRLILACRQSFDFEDRTLCAIVVPMAVRLQSEVHSGKGISEGAPNMLALPSLQVARAAGAVRVVFGARMYTGRG